MPGYFAAAMNAADAGGEPSNLVGRLGQGLKFSLFAGAGIVTALITDLQNRGDSSALFMVAKTAVALVGFLGLASLPLYWIVGAIIGLGSVVVLYFKPHSAKGAFARGFGSLAALLTVVPQYGGEAIPTAEEIGAEPIVEAIGADQVATLETSRHGGFPSMSSAAAAETGAAEAYEVTIAIRFPQGPPEPVTAKIEKGLLKARLHDVEAGRTYDLFRSAGGPIRREGDTLLVETTLPAAAPSTTLFLRIESDGYEIDVKERTVSSGDNGVWRVALEPSARPLLLQRLTHSYGF